MGEKTKICIAVVTNRLIKPQTVLSLLNLKKPCEVFYVIASEGYTTAEGRAYCVIQAKKENCTHILFVDDDMVFTSHTLEKLLSHGKEIVGVASNSRTLPLSTTVSMIDENGNHLPHDKIAFPKIPQELFRCFSVGMGVCLVSMKVFEVIEKPWFRFEAHESGKVLIGEDAWLCKQAREKGIEIYCDGSLFIGHIGDYVY